MLKGTELVEIIAEANGITKKEAKIELDRVVESKKVEFVFLD